jgi:hypothetical protein
MRYFGPLKRSTIIGAFFTGASLCFISALLVQVGVVPPNAGRTIPDNNIVLLPLCLLSISAAGQIIVSRFLTPDPDFQKAVRGWEKYIDNHYPLFDIAIQARSKGLGNAFLVVARNHENVALRRWFLFREDLLVGSSFTRFPT